MTTDGAGNGLTTFNLPPVDWPESARPSALNDLLRKLMGFNSHKRSAEWLKARGNRAKAAKPRRKGNGK